MKTKHGSSAPIKVTECTKNEIKVCDFFGIRVSIQYFMFSHNNMVDN